MAIFERRFLDSTYALSCPCKMETLVSLSVVAEEQVESQYDVLQPVSLLF
jgi:hypothetical protein